VKFGDVWTDGRHRVMWGDATDPRHVNKLLEGHLVHLIVTSPPYPMLKKWNWKGDFHQQHLYLHRVWDHLFCSTIEGGIVCVNIGDALRKVKGVFQLYENHAMILNNFRTTGFNVLPYILWKKPTNKPNSFLGSGMLPSNAYVTLDCEFILLFRKGNIRKFPVRDKNRYKSKYTFEERNKWFSQIWGIPGKKDCAGLSPFPNEIPYRLIRMYSVIGDIVFDPFVGTGTTLIEAEKTGRRCFAMDIKRECCKMAINSLKVVQGEKGRR